MLCCSDFMRQSYFVLKRLFTLSHFTSFFSFLPALFCASRHPSRPLFLSIFRSLIISFHLRFLLSFSSHLFMLLSNFQTSQQLRCSVHLNFHLNAAFASFFSHLFLSFSFPFPFPFIPSAYTQRE